MTLTARNCCAWLIARLLILSGRVRQAKKRALKGDYILSICFHKPSKQEFEFCIGWLKKNNFRFLTTSDVERIVQGELPFPKGGVLLTVDDGWQSNASSVVVVANQYKIPVTIFIATEPVEEGTFWWSYWLNGNGYAVKNGLSVEDLKRMPNQERIRTVKKLKSETLLKRNALTIEQVKTVSASQYITIGGHTHTHPILVKCSDEEVRFELQSSRQRLEQWTGKEVAYFAYPNGNYNLREIQILQELNWRLGFSVDKKQYLTPGHLRDRYSLPRFTFLEGASEAENICRMVGVWRFSLKRKKPVIGSLESDPRSG